MDVRLLASTPEAENLVVAAARLCYSSSSFEELLTWTEERKSALLRKVLAAGHLSVLEHASFTFGVSGISRACSHQLVRHRIASFSQQSQRYVDASGFDAVIPPAIAANGEALRRFNALLEEARTVYAELLAMGIASEDARFVLPNAVKTSLAVTMNARELRHFFSLRCCLRAQWEIRELAGKMLILAREKAPLLFAGVGPACLSGPCPEGGKSCGRMEDVRAAFAAGTIP
ncbi:MAG: FAD-dependent thymidylate synthase [Deltaproteobacteria bacterium]|nr:FAD-dependent thymidylate synthase [Deltaproteobacteria bacterium]